MATLEPVAALSGELQLTHLDASSTAQYALQEAGFHIRYLQQNLYEPAPKGAELQDVLSSADLVLLDFSDNLEAAGVHHDLAIRVGRDEKTTVVLSPGRKPRGGETPFTHIIYRGNADLRKQLRRFIGISEPIFKDHYVRQMAFHAAPEVFGLSDVFVARAALSALGTLRFTGRVETYSSVDRLFSEPKYFFAIGVRPPGPTRQMKREWWMELQAQVGAAVAAQNAGVVLAENFCRSAEVWKFRAYFREDGVVEFADGVPTRVLHPRRARSWFELGAISILHGELPAFLGQSIPRPASDLR